jgi:excisionase family DNA binding protein
MRTTNHIVRMLARETIDVLERRIRDHGLRTEEAARVLGVSTTTVKRWCDQEKLDARQESSRHRSISPESVLRCWEELTAESAAHRSAKATD